MFLCSFFAFFVVCLMNLLFCMFIQMDTISNPLKHASIGIVKGVSKIGGGLAIVSDSVVENAGKIFRTNPMNINLSKETQTFSIIEEAQTEVTKIHFVY